MSHLDIVIVFWRLPISWSSSTFNFWTSSVQLCGGLHLQEVKLDVLLLVAAYSGRLKYVC